MVKIEQSWAKVLEREFEKAYFKDIVDFLKNEKSKGKLIYPAGPEIFKAFELTPFNEVKIVILGQDPYHGAGEAMGLCFSVPKGIKVPPSLVNIFKELQRDLGIPIPSHGDISSWAKQGVLLLNCMLTVEANVASSHKNIGWQTFTDAVIKHISTEKQGVIFMLWGNFAKSKTALIDPKKHYILESVHPSPLAGGKFIGNGHFSKANEILTRNAQETIQWGIIS